MLTLSKVRDFTDTSSQSGYIDIGNIRIQWGLSSVAVDTGTTITLPAAFGNTYYMVTCSPEGAAHGFPADIRGRTTTTFILDRRNTASGTFNWGWIAIGVKP